MKHIGIFISVLSLAFLAGCLGSNDGDTVAPTPKITVLSAYKKDASTFVVKVEMKDYTYSDVNMAPMDMNGQGHWHLEKNMSMNGTTHAGFIAPSFKDELSVDISKIGSTDNLIVTLRNGLHDQVAGAIADTISAAYHFLCLDEPTGTPDKAGNCK